MNRSPFLSISRTFISWVVFICVVVSGQLFVAPEPLAFAQGPAGDPPVPQPTTPVLDMSFQPASNADKLTDFLPPQAIELHLTAEANQLATTATLPNAPLAIHFDQTPVSLMLEADTFSQPVQLSFKLFTSASLTQTTALLQPDLAAGDGISGSQVVTETAVFPRSLIPQTLLQFHVELHDAITGQPVEQFQKKVRLVVDLRQLGFPLDSAYHQFYLAYQDDDLARQSLWSDVPIWVHQQDGLISAEVSHFSDWTAGWRPTSWAPNWTPPSVSTFSGAATYQYTIDIPPGRSSLQPAVSLSYNSRVLDGAIRGAPEGSVASGWSLAEISIAREGVENFVEDEHLKLRHPDRFRLVLNGAGYELFPEPGVDTSSASTVRYYAKDAPNLYVSRVYSASGVPNTEGIYWIVKTAEGTTYRLGYYPDAEEWQRTEHIWQLVLAGHPGHNTTGDQVHASAIRWYVDTVTDVYGNQMVYTYNEATTDQYACGDLCGFELRHWYHKVRLAAISYNFPGRINLSGTVPDNVARLSDTQIPGTRVSFHARGYVDIWGNWNENLIGPIQNILVYHGANVNTANPIKEYRLESRQVHFDPAVTDCPDRSGNYPDMTTTRIVDSIQLWIGTDRNHHGQEGLGNGVYSLPPVEMTYETKPHYYKDGSSSRPCFAYSYLKEVKNGYGGRTVFTYTSDGRSVGQHRVYNYHWVEWPAIGFNYFVSEVRHFDGRSSNPVKTTYSYNNPCYGQTSDDVGGLAGAFACPTAGALEYGNITGFHTAAQINYDYNGATILNKQLTTFSQDANNSIGRPTQIDTYNSSNVLLSRTQHDYASVAINGLANMFTYTSQTRTYQYNSGLGSPTLSTKVTYAYDAANQGGTQYGNLTHIHEYDNATADTPYRTTQRWYYPNTSNGYWAVSQVATEELYDSDGFLLTAARTYYDNATHWTMPPTQGAVTRTRQEILHNDCTPMPTPPSGCVKVRTTVEQAYAYSLFGNQTQQITYSDYGYRAFDSGGTLLQDVAPIQGQTTAIAYETAYNLYPISTTNALGQTLFAFYGFNGVSVDGFQKQPGLLKKVTPPNNVPAIYEYDPFGRLWATYDSEVSRGNIANRGDGDPVTRLRYWDNTWNDSAMFLNPAGNAPFVVSQQQRPGSFPAPANSSSGFAYNDQTFYDGFGRPIQTRSIWHWVEGQSQSQEILTHTDYGANGQVSCQSAPYNVPYYSDQGKIWPASPFYTDETCADKPHTTTTYDALGRPLTVTAPDGSATSYLYDILNSVTVDSYTTLARTRMVDANNRVIGHFSNSLGQLVLAREYSGVHPNPTASADTRYTYDVMGNLTHVGTSDWNNSQPSTFLRQTTMSYDSFGRKISMNDPDMGAWSYRYDAAGSLLRQEANITTADRRVLCFSYDALNRLTRKAGYLSNTACPSSLPGSGTAHLSSQVYDRYQRLDTFDGSSLPSGWAGSGSYSVSGGQAHVTGNGSNYGAYIRRTGAIQDGQGMRFSFSADTANAIGTIYFDTGSWGQSSYRRWGLHISGGFIRVSNYQGTSEETWVLLPFQANTWYEVELVVDGANQMRTVVWQRDNPSIANGVTRYKDSADWNWDELQWTLTSQVHTGMFDYDNYQEFHAADRGQVARTAWGAIPDENQDVFLYDTMGRLTSQTRLIDGRSYTMGYSDFDAFNRPGEITYPNDEVVTVDYDREGENSLAAGDNELVTNIRYNALGQMTFLERDGNIADTTYAYHPQNDSPNVGGTGDSNFRLMTIQHGGAGAGDGDAWPDFTYEYDRVGNITKMTTASNTGADTQAFSYDHLNRLLTAVATGGVANYTHSYTYNQIGNITNFNGAAYTYSSAHKHAVATANGVTYSYDANGNMTFRNASGTANDFAQAFDVENRLITVTNAANVSTFAYDAAGIRVKSVDPDGLITYYPFPVYEEEVWPVATTPPTVNLTANGQTALTVYPNTTFTLQWNTVSAFRCEASGHWSGEKSTTGSEVIAGFATGSRTYLLTCHNSAGSTSQAVTVTVDNSPAVTLTANGVTNLALTPGTGFTLAWSSSSATTCAASGNWSGNKPTSGSQSMSGFTSGSRTYTLACSNSYGTTTRSVVVVIVPAVTLTANGVTNLVLQPGTGFTLAWSSSSATACAASGDWSGNKPTSGSQSMSGFTSGSRTYTLACSNSYGTTTRSVVVTIFETNPCPGGICTEAALMSGGLLAVTEVQTAVQHSTYTVAGQTIAIRITGDWRTTRNGLYYLYADHLGSTSLVADSNGAVVAGSTARYTPFGGWRTEPTAGLTDRGYTGHMHNNLGTGAEDIGLVYMAARWYSPTLGRFISADTIVPNPANPQSLNRYSYVRNSPLNMTDPTGHRECNDPPDCEEGGSYTPPPNTSLFAGAASTPCLHCSHTVQFGDMASAYRVFTELEQELSRPVTYTEVLALVAHHEFGWALGNIQREYDVALEAMGRQFYNFCGTDSVCHDDQLWKFLGAQQAWYAGNAAVFAQELTSGSLPSINFAGAARVLGQPAYDAANATVTQKTANWRSGANVSGVPFKYGNYSMFSREVRAQLAEVDQGINGLAVTTVYLNRPDLNNGNGYVVMTVGQYEYWKGQ